MVEVYSLRNIEKEPVYRQLTGIHDFDWMMGKSIYFEGTCDFPCWGIPLGKQTILTAESGTGKSRFAIKLAKSLLQVPNEVRSHLTADMLWKRGRVMEDTTMDQMNKVLFIQNEVTLSEMKSWISEDPMTVPYMDNFYVCRAQTFEEQYESIERCKPDFVFIDSVNLTEGFRSGRGAREMIEGTSDKPGFKDFLNGILSSGHIFYISHYSKEGGVKGDTDFSHIVDGVMVLERMEDQVQLGFMNKYRYGRTDVKTIWEHKDEGIECVSDNRFKDKQWVQWRGMNDDTTYEEYVDLQEIEKEEKRKEGQSTPIRDKSGKIISKVIEEDPLSEEEHQVIMEEIEEDERPGAIRSFLRMVRYALCGKESQEKKMNRIFKKVRARI
jgi:hypothetical protein